MKKKNYKVCDNCWYLPFCYDNDMGLFDSENKECPNYEEGIEQHKSLEENH